MIVGGGQRGLNIAGRGWNLVVEWYTVLFLVAGRIFSVW